MPTTQRYNVHRWYEPGTGRYLGPDPIHPRRAAPNPFAYVRSRPTFYVDPLGLVERKEDCDECCTDFKKSIELRASHELLREQWTDYAWTPARTWRGESCFDAASQLQRDLEDIIQPKCWISSIQLTKKSDIQICGIYVWVHYVVRYKPCDGKGGDWLLDGFTEPKARPLDPEIVIDEP